MSGPLLRVLALEPYYGGSHRAVLDGLVDRLGAHDIAFDLLTLPPRKWKWRMRGSAITFAEDAQQRGSAWRKSYPGGEPERPGATGPWDVVYASTFVNLAEFVALAGDAVARLPRAVYFHENQLLYPNRHTAEWDFQFPLTNITSALTADACLFNSRYNLEGFLREVPGFLAEFPDHQPKGVAERIAARSAVLQPPFEPMPFDRAPVTRGHRVRIVWPHRWEHDKDPDAFFDAVQALAAEGLDFEVAIAGQSFRETEALVGKRAVALGDRLMHVGQPDSMEAYASLLAGADVAVSTARNEFFGVAMMEACYVGCTPLVPDRLAYPELYPAEYRYKGQESLVAQLRGHILHRPDPMAARGLAEPFTLDALAPSYAAMLRSLAAGE